MSRAQRFTLVIEGILMSILPRQLEKLKQRLVKMGHAVQQSLDAAVGVLLNADADAARVVCAGDKAINEERYSLESDVVGVIATQQPVAHDVRLLIGILEIATELERMADYAKDIARIAIRQAPHGTPGPPFGLVRMADHATAMLEQAMTSFLNGDAQLAKEIIRKDDAVDELCAELHRKLVERAHSDEAELDEAVRLLPAVHDVERFADRVTNICERIVYIETGEQIEFDDQTPL